MARLLGMAVVMLSISASPAAADFIDEVGDTFGSEPFPDIVSVSAVYSTTELTFTVRFLGPIKPASALDPLSVGGFIDIDVDQNPSTGAPPLQNILGPLPDVELGSDFNINLFSERNNPGLVELSSEFGFIDYLAIKFNEKNFEMIIPLSLLSDDGLVNYSVFVGSLTEATDEIPNGIIPATSVAVPEPGTLSLLCIGTIAVLAARRCSLEQWFRDSLSKRAEANSCF